MIKFIKNNWYFIIALVIIIAWSIYNIYCEVNDKEIISFFQASLVNMCTIFITGVFAYILSRNKDVEARKRKIAENFIEKLLNELDERMYGIKDDDDIAYIRIMQKSIFKHLKLLKEVLESLKRNEDVESITDMQQKFQDYWDFVSEHINNIEYLKESRVTLQNKILLISDNLEFILTNLYIK